MEHDIMDNILIQNLQNRDLYAHTVENFQLIETHLSWVILTGTYVYKIKKAVNFGFVDFSTLEKRKYFCEQELLLNKKLARDMYLDIMPIYGTPQNPSFTKQSASKPLEYAIKMRQFDQSQLLTNLQAKHALDKDMIESIAIQLAQFHKLAEQINTQESFGNVEQVSKPMLENFTSCLDMCRTHKNIALLKELEAWTKQSITKLHDRLQYRKTNGFIRQCHGDLHLGNIAYQNNKIIIFDCIEFNESFYWIDTMNDAGFFSMDLLAKQETAFMIRFLNAYLFKSGDYEGLQVLNFYMVYRAMVRAKIALITHQNEQHVDFNTYLSLAKQLTTPKQPLLFITYGFSGSGKSFLSTLLADSISAIHIKSDMERKRIKLEHPEDALYGSVMNSITYTRLLYLAELVLQTNFSVIIDATFIKYNNRKLFANLAKKLTVPFKILHCHAQDSVLSQRIGQREQQGADLSDADTRVLKLQQQSIEPLTTEEQQYTVQIETNQHINIEQLVADLT